VIRARLRARYNNEFKHVQSQHNFILQVKPATCFFQMMVAVLMLITKI